MLLSKIVPAGPAGKSVHAQAGEMVGVPGVEPGTSSLSGTRSNQLSYTPVGGGGNGTRTRDIQLAKLALYQLSYAPGFRRGRARMASPASQAEAARQVPQTCVRLGPCVTAPEGARPRPSGHGRLSVSSRDGPGSPPRDSP